MDWEKARFLMVEQQIRTWDVLDATVLDRLFTVKREDFVPIDKRALAFADMALPLGVGDCTMLSPKMEARIVQEVQVGPDDKVLVVGVGSGYLAALLGSFAKQVYAIDIQPTLVTRAQENMQQAAVKNVLVEWADGNQGWDKYAPYDIIVFTCSLPFLPPMLKNQLTEAGRLFAVLGDAPDMKATLITHQANGTWIEKQLFETCLPVIVNAMQPERFVF